MSASNHILFSAGGLDLAVDSVHVHCVHESLVTEQENGTHDWFLGLAVADERLLPVTDLGQYLQGEQSSGRVLEVARELGRAGLKIDEVHGVTQSLPKTPGIKSFAKAVASRLSMGSAVRMEHEKPEQHDDVHTEHSPILDSVIAEQGRQYHLVDVPKLI